MVHQRLHPEQLHDAPNRHIRKFCPWCGKYIGGDSLNDEYCEAYEKEKKKDPTLPDIMNYSALEDFQEKFLSNWESENQTLEKNQKMQYSKYNQED